MVYNVNQVSYRQALVPTRLQGRLNATMRFIVWGILPLGGVAGGVLAQTYGLHQTIGITAVGTTFGFLWVFFSPVRKIRSMPSPAE